jgi:hypothetical protein
MKIDVSIQDMAMICASLEEASKGLRLGVEASKTLGCPLPSNIDEAADGMDALRERLIGLAKTPGVWS